MKFKEKQILAALVCGAMSFSLNFASVSAETVNETSTTTTDNGALSEYNLDEYVVTANRMNVEKKKVAADTIIIDEENIARNHYNNVSDALKNNNINVVQQAGASYPIINGDKRVLVLVDGRQVNWDHLVISGASGAGVDIDAFPMENVARIEVVRGPNSSLYGNSAVGGVVNIITKRPEAGQQKTKIKLEGGTWNARKASITTQGSDGDFGYLVTLSKEKRDNVDYRTHSGKTIEFPDSDIDRTSETVKLDKKIGNDRLTFDFSNMRSNDGYGLYLKNLEDGTVYNKGVDHDRTERSYALTYNFGFENGNTNDFIRVYQNKEKSSSGYVTSKYKHDLKSTGVDVQKGWNISDNDTLLSGISYMKEDISEQNNKDTFDASANTTGVFLENHWDMKDGWSLNTGMRYENHSDFGGDVTSHVSINKELSDATNAYLSWGQGVKNPTLKMRYADTEFWLGNPDLKQEKSSTLTFGINSELSKDTYLETSIYTSKVNDALEWQAGSAPDGIRGMYRNIAEEKRRGLEFNLSHVLSPQWKVSTGYSYSKIESKDPGKSFVNYDANNRPNGYMLGLSYTQDKWDGDLSLTRVTGRSERYFSDSSYTTLDLGINYHATDDTTIYLKGYNLTNEAYEVNGRLNKGEYISGYAMPSRYFVFGIEQSF